MLFDLEKACQWKASVSPTMSFQQPAKLCDLEEAAGWEDTMQQGIIDVNPLLAWDGTFNSKHLERVYFEDWWASSCEAMLAHTSIVAVMLGLTIPVFAIVVDGRHCVVAQSTFFVTIVCASIFAATQQSPSLRCDAQWKTNLIGSICFLVPTMATWLLSVCCTADAFGFLDFPLRSSL